MSLIPASLIVAAWVSIIALLVLGLAYGLARAVVAIVDGWHRPMARRHKRPVEIGFARNPTHPARNYAAQR